MALYIVVSQMVMDMLATKETRSQAQSLMMFISMGAGSLLGSLVMGNILNIFVSDVNDLAQWRVFWSLPVIVGILTTVLFVFGFRNKSLSAPKLVNEG